MICLVRQGDKYGPEYVSTLLLQLEEHAPLADVITLTDQKDTPGVIQPLEMGWPGWWAKLELFGPQTKDLRPFLFIDLDSFVFGGIDHLNMGDDFTMVRDFNVPDLKNSSVMWIPEDTDEIWNIFTAEPRFHMDEAGGRGDQHFLGKHCTHIWEPLEAGITSYKNHGTEGPTGSIMQFHGHPKPVDTKGWAKARWHDYTS